MGNTDIKSKAAIYDTWYNNPLNQSTINPHTNADTSRLAQPTSTQIRENYAIYGLEAPIDLEDVKFFIKRLKNRKTPGKSGITNKMLKKLPDEFLLNFVNIFNAALSMGYFPKAFKQATTIMIHKKGKSSTDPLNYRPFALLESVGKIYERIINRRLRLFLEDNNKLYYHQFGFRSHRSTHTNIHTMMNFISNARKRNLLN